MNGGERERERGEEEAERGTNTSSQSRDNNQTTAHVGASEQEKTVGSMMEHYEQTV